MWGWDPSQGDGPAGGSSPTLLPVEAAPSSTPVAQPQPVLVPNVQGLKQQFQQQQSLLAHIKETLRENDADRTSKEKQLEMYANKLSQIKNRSKNAQKKPGEVLQSPTHNEPLRDVSQENLDGMPVRKSDDAAEDANKRMSAKGKMNELKKRLEENKIKFEERTEKGMTETRKIESIVEQLRTQVQERDTTIHELQKTMDTPPPSRPKPSTTGKRHREKPLIISKWTQTHNAENMDVTPRIKELEATIVDLQDTVKQQKSVIAARTRAVTLLSEDLGKKGKSTVDELEDTRREMRDMQKHFIAVESNLKSDLNAKDNKLASLEDEMRSLTSLNTEILEKNLVTEAQLRATLVEMETLQSNVDELGRTGFVAVGNSNDQLCELEKKVAELTKELEESNKLTIRLKLEHKNKLKAANKTIETLKKSSDEKNELVRLATKVDELESVKSKLVSKIAELEEEKGNLLLSVLDIDELKASSSAYKIHTDDLENQIRSKVLEIEGLKQKLASSDEEKQVLIQTIEDQNILVDNLNARINSLELDSTGMEPFDIPGDGAARQFDISNQHVQGQIESLVKEKQELLEKLKNLSGVASTESSTYDKIEDLIEPEEVMLKNEELSSSVPPEDLLKTIVNLNQSLAEEKDRTKDYKIRISELENALAALENSSAEPQGRKNLKGKIQKLENDLKNEKCRIEELNQSLKAKEELIQVLNEKLSALEQGSGEGDWGVDVIDVAATQQKCLSLESNLLQLTQQCEHLRKENIEVVHQLSGEKVRRIRAEEEVEAVRIVRAAAEGLEDRVAALEVMELDKGSERAELEYANIVIASKDTEIFNIQSALADKTQILDTLKEENERVVKQCEIHRVQLEKRTSEINELRARLADAGLELESRHAAVRQLQEMIQNRDQQLAELDRSSLDQASSYSRRIDELSTSVSEKSEKCIKLKEELHRLQVTLESLMAESAMVAQERAAAEEKLGRVERALHEEQTNRQNTDVLARQRDDALLKLEETEKVLQKTWAERNDLIQSREVIYHRLSEVEHNFKMASAERDEANQRCEELMRKLADTSSEDQSLVADLNVVIDECKKDLVTKHQELESMTVKAKKLAANLKKKNQTEKDLSDQLSALKVERDLLVKRLSDEQNMVEKWATENNEKENLIRQHTTLLAEKEQLMSENYAKLQENEALTLQMNSINQQMSLLLAEKNHLAKELESSQNEKSFLATRLAEESQNLLAAKERLASVLSENTNLSDKLSGMEEKYVAEKSEKEQIKAKTASELKFLQQAFELEQQENEALMCQRAAILQEKEQLCKQLENALMRIEALEQDKQNLSEQLEMLNTSLQNAKNNEEKDISRLRERNENLDASLRETLMVLEKEKLVNSNLIVENQTLSGQLDKLNASSLEKEDERNNRFIEDSKKLAQLTEENSVLERKMNEKDESLVVFEARIQESTQTIADLQTFVALVEEEKKRSQELYATLDSETKLQTEQYNNRIAQLEKQLSNFNLAFDAEVQKNSALKHELDMLLSILHEKISETPALTDSNRVEEEKSERKKKKSVTFRTDDVDYIKELKGEVASLQRALDESDTTVGELKQALVVKQKTESSATPVYDETIISFKVNLFQEPLTDDRIQEEKSERKKKKSVTFRTDDVDYIKELKGEVASLQRALVESDTTVGELKQALVVKQKTESSPTPVSDEAIKSFNVNLFQEPLADDFLSNPEPSDPFLEESLTWDDSWGAEGQLEEEHATSKSSQVDAEKVFKLESELKALHAENEVVQENFRVLQVKYAKVIKKLKEQKSIIDRLQAEVKSAKMNIGFGDLDAALMEELRAEMVKAESKESETRKELEAMKQEKETLLKRIDVLSAGNERFLELKERQDSETALWQSKNAELRAQVTELQAQLQAPPLDDTQLALQNRELKNLIEGLEWKVCELTEMIDEKDEELTLRASQRETMKLVESTRSNDELDATEKLRDVEEQMTLLAAENETLQGILNEQRLLSQSSATDEAPALLAAKKPLMLPSSSLVPVQEPPPLSHWFPLEQSQPFHFPTQENTESLTADNSRLVEEIKSLKDQLNFKDQEIEKLSNELSASCQKFTIDRTKIENELRLKQEEVLCLLQKIDAIQKAYGESKSEIDRLLSEERMRSDSPLEEELAKARRSIETEKSRCEAAFNELASLRHSFDNAERESDETLDRNNAKVKELKAHLRELEASVALATVEKDKEVQRLRVECSDLRDLCDSRDAEITHLRNELVVLNHEMETKQAAASQLKENEFSLQLHEELSSVKQILQEKAEELLQAQSLLDLKNQELESLKQISEELPNLQQRLAVRESELRESEQISLSVEGELFSQDAEVRELRAELISREAELREMRADLVALRDEVSQFRNFDKQLMDLQKMRGGLSGQTAGLPGDVEGDWRGQNAADLCSRLQSDLDSAMYMLHQRDVRCDELTFELMQLLEERDTLQLRLSEAIRKNEEMRSTPAETPRPSPHLKEPPPGDLANKISELHNVGYSRDKNIQDDSQHRHREQMAFLAREQRARANTQVLDV